MALTQPRRVAPRVSRSREWLTGVLRLVRDSQWRKRVPRQNGRSSCDSPEGLAGSDVKPEATAGGSAHTTAARAAGQQRNAVPAGLTANTAGSTPRETRKGKEGSEVGRGKSTGKPEQNKNMESKAKDGKGDNRATDK